MRRNTVVCVVVSLVLAVTGLTAASDASPGSAATTAWHRVAAPIPTGRTRPGPYVGVSCPTSSFCMAIANGLGSRGYRVGIAEIERQNRWTASDTPPIGPTGSALSGVSCASATSCVVVGRSGASSPEIMRWNGTRWRVLTGSTTAGEGPVTAVSCASANYCVALGTSHDWIVRGDRLTQVAPSRVATAISCVSATYCLAVGTIERSGNRLNLVERWNGSTWSNVPAGDVPGRKAVVTLTGVSCAAVAECSVVGDAIAMSTSGWRYRFLTDTDVAGAWRRQTFPKAARIDVHRTSHEVSCSSPTQCVAVGRGRVDGKPATETLVGGRGGWRLTSAHYAHGGVLAARLTAISCNSGGCTLVGGGRGPDASGRIVHLHGATARRETPAAIRQADASALSSVSCSGSSCLAVGHKQIPGSPLSPFAATNTGNGWQQISAPRFNGELNAVSCVTAQFCMAVGRGVRRAVGTAAIWNGTGWRSVTVTGGPVRGVTCPTTQFCAGSPLHRGDQLLWQVWHPGTGWQTETLAPPKGLRRQGPISCASATDCWTTRTYYGADSSYHVLASHWDGSAWTTQGLPGRFILDISCPADGFCIAVGPKKAQVWDGTTWTGVPYANGASLNPPHVSCVAADDCTVIAGTPTWTDLNTITQHWDGQAWGEQQAYPVSIFDVSSLGCDASGCVTVGETEPRAEIPTVMQNY